MSTTRNPLRSSRHLLFFMALSLSACGGGSSGGSGSGSMTPLAPTITIAVQPTTITLGQSTTVTWSSTNSATCTASGAWSGTEATSGNQTITPTATGTATYTLTCVAPTGGAYSGGGGGSSAMSASLTVNAASAFTAKNLVADTSGTSATTVDPNLVNPWGLVFAPTAPVWIANNHSETSTLYDGNGAPIPAGTPLVVQLAASPGGVAFDPTGIVFNSTTDFKVSTAGGTPAAAAFIFSGEGGMIAGWARSVDATHAITMFTDAGGAVYKGLAVGNNGSGNFLYATDFHNNKIDVFDATYIKQATSASSFTFVDPTLPVGYAPFGIQAIQASSTAAVQLYVAYAMQQGPDNHDNSSGAGLGIVDIFDLKGGFIKRLVTTGGALNAPWGLALAPADFGTLSKMLLVGNFGDGKINAYDPSSGTFIGAVTDATGTAFVSPGLWGIAFGNDAVSQPHNTLYFTAGPNDEANGIYGRIDLNP